MPLSPYANLRVSRNGGAVQTGGVACAFGDSIQLSPGSTLGIYAWKWEIYNFRVGITFPCPAGWSTAADGSYYYAGGATPPAFTLPSSHADFSKFLLRLTINNGDPGASGLPAAQFVDNSTALELVSDAGVRDTAYLEDNQFDEQGAIAALRADLAILAVLAGGVGPLSIADHSVTFVKIQTIPTQTLMGRGSAGTGNVESITVGGGVEFTGTAIQRSALTGDVTASAGSATTTIANNAVSFAKMADIGVGLIGNDTGTADPKLITLGSGLAFSGGALIASAVALSSFANIAANSILGNNTGSPAAPIALTGTQVTALLDVGDATHKGLAPAPGSSTGKYLKDDFTWGTPAGSFTNPSNPGDNAKVAYANAGALAYASAIKTDGSYLAFGGVDPTVLTIGTERFAHNTHVMSGLGSDGTTNYDLVQWGVTTNNRFLLGSSTVPITELQAKQIKATATAQTGTPATAVTIAGGAHTALTASTELTDFLLDLSQTKQWSTGAFSTSQPIRAARILAPTIAFVGASTAAHVATLAISGAPAVGTNATLTNSLALWLESGSIGYGAAATMAKTGLHRYGQSATMQVAQLSGGTDVNLSRFGVLATDQHTIGDDNLPALWNYAQTTWGVRVGAATKLTVSTTTADFNSLNVTNVNALNGVRVATGTLGTALADSNVTLSVAGGGVYELQTNLSANRSIALAVTGSPRDKQVISIRKYTTAAFNLTVTDEVGNPLYTFPQASKGIADFQYSSATSKFVLAGNMDLS